MVRAFWWKRSKRYLALGDSYTIGEGVAVAERFPVQLVDTVVEKNNIALDLEIVAKTGWTTEDLIRNIPRTSIFRKYQLITLLIGVNNQYNAIPIEKFKRDYRFLISWSLKRLTRSGQLICVGIPNYGNTPYASHFDSELIKMELQNYNEYIMTMAAEYNLSYIDIFNLSERCNEEGLLVKDLLHPSRQQYRKWVEAIYTRIDNL